MENKIYGYVRKICPSCDPGNKNSKSKAKYWVYETNTHLILKCTKCKSQIKVEKANYGKQIEAKPL